MAATALSISRDAAARATLALLQPFLSDPDVYELRINAFGQVVCATSGGNVFHDVPAVTAGYVKRLTATLLHYNEKSLSPVNDVVLPDGERGVICVPPAVAEGTVAICFRKHAVHGLTLDDWREQGHFDQLRYKPVVPSDAELTESEQHMLALYERGPQHVEQFLAAAVPAKLTICVSGKTGSGKTTFTETLLSYVSPDERVVVLEDIHEVQAPAQKEAVFMMYSSKPGDGRISAKDCITACMRLTPDRIFLTELRDEAAYSFIDSANTGHPGSIFSVHANSAAAAPGRIANLIKKSEEGSHLEYPFILADVRSTVDVFIHMTKRNVLEIIYNPYAKHDALA